MLIVIAILAFYALVIGFICWQTRKEKRTGKSQFLALSWPLDEAWQNDLPPRERLEACLQEMQKREESGEELDLVLLTKIQVALEKLAKNAKDPVEATAFSSMSTAMQYLDETK